MRPTASPAGLSPMPSNHVDPRPSRGPRLALHRLACRGGVLTTLLLLGAAAPGARAADPPKAAARPALSVTVTSPVRAELTARIEAHGGIAAWQEASISAEGSGWRVLELRAQVGDRVKRGQVLAEFAADLVQADLALARAGVAEAEALLAEAGARAQRARELQPTGVISTEQAQQAYTAERTAQARLEAQRAGLRLQQLRVQQTRVLSPDDGVVSSRSATLGAVLAPGQELFRMIRQGRIEWRAEVASDDLARIRPGMEVTVLPPGGAPVAGRVRVVAPTVDAATRNGMVLVDLPAAGGARPGMFASGAIKVGGSTALTLPQAAVVLRDGFAYAFVVGAEGRVRQAKLSVGRRSGTQIEVLSGVGAADRVVASGAGFLTDGDLVRVVDAPRLTP